IKTKKGVISLIQDIKDLEIIKLIHLNDSKTKIGSKTDRHEHLGKGEIGKEGFKNFFSFKEFKNIPLILETPKKSLNDDLKNIQTAISIIEV
ncbi:MAG TPA: TIM barrel protein, partial [Elusimicrobiales bacterium]|nr:TIM barrel protein [Elusimicrobiales bacterium]